MAAKKLDRQRHMLVQVTAQIESRAFAVGIQDADLCHEFPVWVENANFGTIWTLAEGAA
jgi:hypothetical protein